MADYTDMVSRATGQSDALVPEPVSAEIIQELPKQSAALTLMRRANLSSKTERMPVLNVLPFAYFVGTGNDTGMKQTTTQQWANVTLVVEEIATIVPIPEAYLADADVPIWSEVQPRMIEALGQLIDAAVFWGVNKPSTWGTDIFTAALAAGNAVEDGFSTAYGAGSPVAVDDFGASITALGDLMAQTGYTVSGFAGRPGLNWRLMGLRSSGSGVPIFGANSIPVDGQPGRNLDSLYGYPLSMIENGSWDYGQSTPRAQILAGDFSKAILGVRQDITFKMFSEGVISNDSGQVILNLMQQDSVAMRLVMRLAYATVNPVTIMARNKTITQRFPFGVVTTNGVNPV